MSGLREFRIIKPSKWNSFHFASNWSTMKFDNHKRQLGARRGSLCSIFICRVGSKCCTEKQCISHVNISSKKDQNPRTSFSWIKISQHLQNRTTRKKTKKKQGQKKELYAGIHSIYSFIENKDRETIENNRYRILNVNVLKYFSKKISFILPLSSSL